MLKDDGGGVNNNALCARAAVSQRTRVTDFSFMFSLTSCCGDNSQHIVAQRRCFSNLRLALSGRAVRIKRGWGVVSLFHLRVFLSSQTRARASTPVRVFFFRRQEVGLIVLTKRTLYPFTNRSTQMMSMNPPHKKKKKTIAAWSSVSTTPSARAGRRRRCIQVCVLSKCLQCR